MIFYVERAEVAEGPSGATSALSPS